MLAMVESYTGTRAATCPWSAFAVPIVVDTLSAYSFFESGQLAASIGADPANVMVEAVECYHNALNRTRDKMSRDREAERAHDAAHAASVREMTRRG